MKSSGNSVVNIREGQIEDVLAAYPDLLKEIIQTDDEITLISRQKILPSDNRIDLLLIGGRKILLVELKVVRFDKRQVRQVTGYEEELKGLQAAGKLVEGEIVPYLLCTAFREEDRALCERHGIRLRNFSPEYVLQSFYDRLQRMASFMTLKPTNHGLWNLHLINRILYPMNGACTLENLQRESSLSKSTIRSYLALTQELGLVKADKASWSLSDIGRRYVFNRDTQCPVEHISDGQSAVLQSAIIENPFGSGAILGIYTLVESVYDLARNTYPVQQDHLAEYFRQASGRLFDWTSRKTVTDSMKMYANYAIDLGLVGRIGDKVYLTPDGVRFILLLNLHKTLKIVDALGISRSNR